MAKTLELDLDVDSPEKVSIVLENAASKFFESEIHMGQDCQNTYQGVKGN